MRSIDQQYRMTRMTLRSHLGSTLATVAVFAAIASTGMQMGALEPDADEDRPIYYLAPPLDQAQSPSASRRAPPTLEALPLEALVDNEAVELSLEPIDISLSPDMKGSFSLDLEQERQFQANAPELSEFEAFTIFERSEVDRPPLIRYSRAPDVPIELRGDEVEVIAFYFVDDKGRTANHSILDSSSPDPRYGELAVDSIKTWRFRPAQKDGKAVPCWVQQTIKFNRGSTSPFTL